MCRISIITPVYNGMPYLEDCLRSVTEQADDGVEHVIVDGGSDDGSVQLIREYARKYDHIRWISEKDRGQSDAMNKGIGLARGEVLGILNADDYYEEGTLHRVQELFSGEEKPALLVANCNIWDSEGSLKYVWKPKSLRFPDLVSDPDQFPHPPNPSAYFYHKSLHDLVGLYDVTDHYAMDLDFLLRALKVVKARYYDETWGNFRMLNSSKTVEEWRKGNAEKRRDKVIHRYLPRFGSKRTVLFLTRDASRTGAPLFLLNLLRWIRSHSDLKFEVLIEDTAGHKGELLGEFQKLASVTTLDRELAPRYTYRGKLQRYLYQRLLRGHCRGKDIGLIYSNTVVNSRSLKLLKPLGCPVLTHVHELNQTIRWGLGLEAFEEIRQVTKRFIAVSKAVKQNLVEEYGVHDTDIDLVYDFIPSSTMVKKYEVRRNIREELNIPPEAYIVGSLGSITSRKGADLFVQLAQRFEERNLGAPVYFVWAGGPKSGLLYGAIWDDLRKLGLDGKVRYIGGVDDPFPWYAGFDVFALLSREDPCPLVVLESASMEKPIICFENSGGTPEFLEGDCGIVVPYLDVDAMADAVSGLLQNKLKRVQMGKKAVEKVRKEYIIDVGAPKILSVIEELLLG